ncbi:MAG: SUMF1/EgtB/PvdO family nonheme iron enzyme [Gammaproteobacteria bacterium]|nr:SUMF1/EgtB/PvdO family nonheme iron enzyme [Gammaproteobacteria bacterium]
MAIEGGCFLMGSAASDAQRDPDERRHEVCVDDFEIARYEVTFDEYDRFAAATGREPPYDEGWGRGRQPVINVSWEDATAYAQWLSKATGRIYRLPTEAEWEYACRSGGQAQRYCGAQRANPYGCYADNCRGRAHQVGGRPPNALGIHDMSGNVGEWTCSTYDPRYRGSEARCAGPHEDGARVGRGGSWLDEEHYLRAASRDGNHKRFRAITLGFRLARDGGPCLRLAGTAPASDAC